MSTVEARHAVSAGSELLALRGVSKSFGGRSVLRDVSLRARLGSVLGLAGENGAGKSTLLKIAAGLEVPEAGRIAVRGEEVRLRGYGTAMEYGISMVFQEQALVPNIPVYENLFLGMTAHFARSGVIKRSAMRTRAEDLLESFGLSHLVRSERLIGEYDFGRRQLVEIVRAFAVAELADVDHPVVLLDEATAALTEEERHILFSVIERVRPHAALVFVSHLLGELLELCDEVLVLKDGAEVTTLATADTTADRLHQLITGREVPEAFYVEEAQRSELGEVVMRVSDLSRPPDFHDVSFQVRAGEILGIAGVAGSGKEVLGRIIAGVEKAEHGTIWVDGKDRVGYVPKERKEEGLIIDHSVLWNGSLAGLVQGAFTRGGLLQLHAEREKVQEMVRNLDVRPADVNTTIGYLSGGNQQKVVIGRWTLVSPRVLVLDSPTRGVDVGSRHAIYRLARDLCDAGMAIILISDDLLEVIGLSNRILTMRDRRVVTEVPAAVGGKPTEGHLVAHLV